MNDYNRNKTIFNNLLKNNYKIRKLSHDELIIIMNNSKIKCKYMLLLTEINNNYLWADDNYFNDKKTITKIREIREIIKEKLKIETDKIDRKKLLEIFEYLLKNNIEWILTNNKEKYIEYYIISEIIYY